MIITESWRGKQWRGLSTITYIQWRPRRLMTEAHTRHNPLPAHVTYLIIDRRFSQHDYRLSPYASRFHYRSAAPSALHYACPLLYPRPLRPATGLGLWCCPGESNTAASKWWILKPRLDCFTNRTHTWLDARYQHYCRYAHGIVLSHLKLFFSLS